MLDFMAGTTFARPFATALAVACAILTLGGRLMPRCLKSIVTVEVVGRIFVDVVEGL